MSFIIPRPSRQALILLGAPASGKDTLADQLQLDGFDVIAPGNFRRLIAASGTELGKRIERARDRNPARFRALMMECMITTITHSRKPLVLNGVARNPEQAAALDWLLHGLGFLPQDIHVVRLEVSDKILYKRMQNRRDSTLNPREADTNRIYRLRLWDYMQKRRAVKDYYGPRMQHVNADTTPARVQEQVYNILALPLRPPAMSSKPAPEPHPTLAQE